MYYPSLNDGIKHLNTEEKAKIIELNAKGVASRQIGRIVKKSHKSVCRFIKKWTQTGKLVVVERRGRKMKTSDREDRLIALAVRRDPWITAKDVQALPGMARLSLNTIRRRFTKRGDIKSYWSAKKPWISERNRQKRLLWCREHLNWTVHEWRRVLWSDESPFVLRFNKRRRVWRLHNSRYKPRYCNGTVKHDTKIMVWGCFAAHGVGHLKRIEGIMDAQKYLDILDEPMIHSADLLFGRDNWKFQQDNDPKHTAKVVQEWMHDNEVPRLEDWPAQSPDLNPIENLWSILDANLKDRQVNNAEELFNVLNQAWRALPVDILDRLVSSMPSRCQAVIENNGYATKY